jgi:hypothetical protein
VRKNLIFVASSRPSEARAGIGEPDKGLVGDLKNRGSPAPDLRSASSGVTSSQDSKILVGQVEYLRVRSAQYSNTIQNRTGQPAFPPENCAFAGQSPMVAAKFTAFCKHAVAGDNKRDGIAANCCSDRP